MKRRASFRRPPKLPRTGRKPSASEAVHPTHRKRLQRLAGEAGTRRILAIGGNAVAARAEVVVPSGVIRLAGIHGIPVGLLVEMVLVADRVHVGHVVDRTHARITRRLPGMRPPPRPPPWGRSRGTPGGPGVGRGNTPTPRTYPTTN